MTAREQAAFEAGIENGMFAVVTGTNEKGRPTPFVEVGQWAGD